MRLHYSIAFRISTPDAYNLMQALAYALAQIAAIGPFRGDFRTTALDHRDAHNACAQLRPSSGMSNGT
jgi:hypothetical protein